MGQLWESYMEISTQKQQSTPREENAKGIAPPSVPGPNPVVVEDSDSAERPRTRGMKRNR